MQDKVRPQSATSLDGGSSAVLVVDKGSSIGCGVGPIEEGLVL